jgi:aerotaxis receptor
MAINLGNREEKLSSDSMIVTETDSKGIITFASEDFCKIAGYTKEELVGQPHNMIRHNFMPSAAFKDLWNTVQSGQIWTGIIVNKTKSGGFYWVKANVYPSKNADGTVQYISVGVMPSVEEIEHAIATYPTL